MKILLVDDSAPILRGVEMMIRRISGYEFDIRKAPNALEAIEIMKDFSPDLMIVDIIMPGMNGLAFLEYSFKAGYEGKIVLLSAYGEFSYAQQAIRLGVIDYLLKPIEESKLVNIVETLARKLHSAESGARLMDPSVLKLTDYSQMDQSGFPPILHLILNYIDEHYREDVSLPMLAQKCNISTTYICTLFATHMNTTLLSYLDHVRLRRAAYDLAYTNRSLETIAQETGFKYANQLLRVFKKRVGITPSQFRRKHFTPSPDLGA